MSVVIYNDTKVFIACPANAATGGPELLHQLGYSLINNLNISAFMYYYNFDSSKFETPVHPEYKTYKVPYVLEISHEEDVEKNVLIVPEVFDALSLLPKYRNIRKGIWLLSVDNYYYSRLKKTDFFFKRIVNKIFRFFNKLPVYDIHANKNLQVLKKKYSYVDDKLLNLANFYLAQSYYAMEWFKELKPLYYLSDFINPDFLKTQIDLSQKRNIVVYNPKKGTSFTKKIISQSKGIEFVAIINMSRKEIIQTLQKAKVYIDFGNHPGKDRLPREAAILGCCIITGRRGSAAYFQDVPIPDKYKFEDVEENIPAIIEKIKYCLDNYEDCYKNFEYYRNVIRQEQQKFVEDLKKIFVKIG